MAQSAPDPETFTEKRRRFEEAGKFPVRKVVLIGLAVVVVLFGGFYGYGKYRASQEVGGVMIMPDVEYPATQVEMVSIDAAAQAPEGIAIALGDLKQDFLVGFTYARANPMPEGYQLAAGGNILPLMAYVAPSGRLVVATSFCEPCRSTIFHFEEKQLVCDVCFTRWDLSTLIGIRGGCFDYPPEEVRAEVRGDQVFVPQPDLESWVPRGYQDAVPIDPTMSTLPAVEQ